MAEELTDDFWQEFEDDSADEAEKKFDAKADKLAKKVAAMEAKQKAKEDAEEADRLVDDFMTSVPDDYKDVFATLLAGVETPEKAKAAISKMQPKLSALAPKEAEPEPEPEEEPEAEALSGPIDGEPSRPHSREDQLIAVVGSGTAGSEDQARALLELLAPDSSFIDAVLSGGDLPKKK